MPSPTDLQIIVVSEARRFPDFAQRALVADPVRANLILPTLHKCVHLENNGYVLDGHLWIIVHVAQNVKFIAACTRGYMGNYPLFIYTPVPSQYHDPESIKPCLWMIASALMRSNVISPRRIYSVFAQEAITATFADIWSELTGIRVERTPYYHAKISYATQDSVARCDRSVRPIPGAVCDLRPAVPADIEGVADCCYRFAADSEPFTLTWERAMEEARILINERQVWVYTATFPDGTTGIASIVAFTRNTEVAAAITKVFTHPNFRSRGCAERLVRRVCKHLLKTRTFVVLYVGLDNRAANVYQKVGFLGVGEGAQPVQGVDNWLETGFDRSQVRLGHW